MNYKRILETITENPDSFMTKDGYLNKLKIKICFKLSETEWQQLSELWREQRDSQLSRGNR